MRLSLAKTCPTVHPSLRKNAGPLAVVTFLTKMVLFTGPSPPFFAALNAIARAADKARRHMQGGEGGEEEEEV
jgi:hypothetical protein